VNRFCQAEIEDFDAALAGNQDVVGLNLTFSQSLGKRIGSGAIGRE
jgi:hypothetical protein